MSRAWFDPLSVLSQLVVTVPLGVLVEKLVIEESISASTVEKACGPKASVVPSKLLLTSIVDQSHPPVPDN